MFLVNKIKNPILFYLLTVYSVSLNAQIDQDKEFTSLVEAFKAPLEVYHLMIESCDELINVSDTLHLDKLVNLESVGIEDCIVFKFSQDICKLKKLRTIYLPRNRLPYISSCIVKMDSLESVYASHNEIRRLPGKIGSCPKLKNLHLNFNPILTLPKSFSRLKKFDELSLYMCDQLDLVHTFTKIGQLDSLNSLVLGNHTKLPDEIGLLTNVKHLSIGYFPSLHEFGVTGTNKDSNIDSLPASIGNLNQLETLDLSFNKISHLPVELFQLKNLKCLVLTGNVILEIQDEIANLKKLETLDVSGTNLDERSIKRLKKILPDCTVVQ